MNLDQDHGVLAAGAALLAGALGWFARGIRAGHWAGRMEGTISSIHDELKGARNWRVEHDRKDYAFEAELRAEVRALRTEIAAVAAKVSTIEGAWAEHNRQAD